MKGVDKVVLRKKRIETSPSKPSTVAYPPENPPSTSFNIRRLKSRPKVSPLATRGRTRSTKSFQILPSLQEKLLPSMLSDKRPVKTRSFKQKRPAMQESENPSILASINYPSLEFPQKRSSSESRPPYSETLPVSNFSGQTSKVEFSANLPLDLYDPVSDVLSPAEFLESYKKLSPKAAGYSKWFFGNGTYEWRSCNIEKYDADKELFVIVWENGSKKLVSRINLRLEGESEAEFEERISGARKHRDDAEISLRFTALVSFQSNELLKISAKILTFIVFFLKGGSCCNLKNYVAADEYLKRPLDRRHDPNRFLWTDVLSHLEDELNLLRVKDLKSHEDLINFTFNDLDAFDLFAFSHSVYSRVSKERVMKLVKEVENWWDLSMKEIDFLARNQRLLKNSSFAVKLRENSKSQACRTPTANPARFVRMFDSFNSTSLLRSAEVFKILSRIHETVLSLDQTSLFPNTSLVQTELIDFLLLYSSSAEKFFTCIRNAILDSQCDIQDILTKEDVKRIQRNERKLKERVHSKQVIELEDSLPSSLLQFVKKLVYVCNMKIEDKAREGLNKSVNFLRKEFQCAKKALKESLRDGETLNSEDIEKVLGKGSRFVNIRLEINVNDCKVECVPSFEQFSAQLNDFVEYLKNSISDLKCISTIQTGPSRSRGYLQIIEINKERFLANLKKLNSNLAFQYQLIHLFIHKLEPYNFAITLNPEELYTEFKTSTTDDIEDEIFRLKRNEVEICEILECDSMLLGIWNIDTQKVRTFLTSQLESAIASLYQLLLTSTRGIVEEIRNQYNDVLSSIDLVPKNIEELEEMRKYIKLNFESKSEFISSQLVLIFTNIEVLEGYFYQIPSQLYTDSWTSIGFIKDMQKVRVNSLNVISDKLEEFTKDLNQERIKLFEDIENMTKQLKVLTAEEDINNYENIFYEFSTLKNDLQNASKSAEIMNSRETIIDEVPSNFRILDETKREFNPYMKLWTFIREFTLKEPTYMTGPMWQLSRDQIASEINTYITECARMEKNQFKDNPAALKVVQEFIQRVQMFKPFIPVIKIFNNPGMKDRHWQDILQKTSLNITISKTLTLKHVIEQGTLEHLEFMDSISELANKELGLENAKKKMENEWFEISFEYVEYKGTYVLVNTEKILDPLNEQLMRTNAMLSSPFIRFIINEMNTWKSTLIRISEMISIWETFQRTWQYLQPIFASKDISDELPEAAATFKTVNSQWVNIMNSMIHTQNVFEFCLGQPKTYEIFTYGNENLERVMKSLNEYLLSKRKDFPRFYFLSNEELVTILSNSQDLESIQKYIIKCFEGIASVVMENKRLVSMVSPEGEKVKFVKNIEFFNGAQIKSIEVWMNDLEKEMIETLKIVLEKCNSDSVKDLKQWVSAWPSQLVHASMMALWTAGVENGLMKNCLPKFLQHSEEKLGNLVSIVRGNLSSLDRMTFSTMVVLDVHNKDITESLVLNKVQKIDDFSWFSNMRYYMVDHIMEIRMIDCLRKYGYEYLGIAIRLVITKLTDRCYMTLMCALNLCLGGAPEGPAGTGKTETVKDLAKGLAMKCVVFNCSDRLDHVYMAKFFTGLCFCGAWACFDEFNRIELEVLSVIAEQILTIQMAVQKKSETFKMDSDEVTLNQTVAVFITMNPDYAGRSKLPDNLKALFRPVAMMTPDYSLIAEIYLYSFGFREARSLSRKIVNSLKLSSEQLSSQFHYDYGMRAVSTIIKAAGLYKQSNPNDKEELLVLRAITGTNLPKFIKQDVPLFNGIVLDLFPGVSEQQNDENDLISDISSAILDKTLFPAAKFIDKIVEIYRTTLLRHGLMLVGPTMSGKTTAISTLAKALSLRAEVELFVMNPKSMSLGQLYGDNDPVSQDWKDGILGLTIRKLAESKSQGFQWVLLDGPVDAVWIESLNTVMDDNKKLCLASGEIIKFTPSMRMIFEVDDLSQASPATVSRCGMIYLNAEDVLGPKPLIESWLLRLPSGLKSDEYSELFRFLFEQVFLEVLDYWNEKIKHLSTTALNSLQVTRTMIQIFQSLIIRKGKSRKQHDVLVREEEEMARVAAAETAAAESSVKKQPTRTLTRKNTRELTKMSTERVAMNKDKYINLFIVSLIWSLGGTCNETGKRLLCEKITEKSKNSFDLPPDLLNFYYNDQSCQWEELTFDVLSTQKEMTVNNLIIFTPRLRASFFILNELLSRKENLIITGDTASGKTFLVSYILSSFDKTYTLTSTMLTARTGSNEMQSLIENDLTRRKKSVIGPENGKFKIFLIDDLNMSTKEKYGAVPAIEVLRFLMEKGELIDRQSLEVKNVEDVQFLGVIGLPSGSHNTMSPRFISKNIVIHFESYSNDVLIFIIKSIFDLGLSSHSQTVQDTVSRLSKATIQVFRELTSALPPTPTKSHYIFNLRDLINVTKGLLMSPSTKLCTFAGVQKLWTHETIRTFSDRLINPSDIKTFENIVKSALKQVFEADPSEVFRNELIFVNFMDDKVYQELENSTRIKQTLENFLDDYNSDNTVQMNLIIFDYALQHICRISRVLSWTSGHLLLIGMGGSGRSSLTRLCGYFMKMQVFQIKVMKIYGMFEWFEDIKNLLRLAGQEDKKTIFILRDSEIILESFLETINCLLNSGSVPNLYSNEETSTILEAIKTVKLYAALPAAQRWEVFLANIKKNLHIVLCMFPGGEQLRTRFRQFPSLVTCTNIDWFFEWPEQALSKVAEFYLNEENFIENSKIASVIQICVKYHLSIRDLSVKYLQEQKRENYVTPTHYLLLLRSLKHLYGYKEQTTIKLSQKYRDGIEKLDKTQVLVERLRQHLTGLKPALDEKKQLAQNTLDLIELENKEADKTRELVAAEQAACEEQTNFAEGIKKECQDALSQALPELEAAIKALDTIKKDDLDLVKAMYKPPEAVRITLEAVAIINRQPPVRIRDPDNPSSTILDYYEAGKKLLSVYRFIQMLKTFDRESLDAEIISRISVYIKNPKFNPDIVKRASSAAQGMCKWVRAMYNFYFVNNQIKPKIAALTVAEEDVKIKKAMLEAKQEELKIVEHEISLLRLKLEGQMQEYNVLMEDVRQVEVKLERSVKLIDQLSDEKASWTNKVSNFSSDLENLLGDVLLSAGVITYFGPFTLNYREKVILDIWIPLFRQIACIPCSDPYSLARAVGDAEMVQKWNLCGLPSDKVSIENSLIIHHTLTWPLIVDPQQQAGKWLKKMFLTFKVNLFKVKPENSDFMSVLENSMFLGGTLLIEDLKEFVDPVLDPLLGKQWFKQDSSYVIKLGDSAKEIDLSFKLYLLSNYSNPKFSPEITTKVTLLNFSITEEGLAEQILDVVCRYEMPRETEERDTLILQCADYTRKMQAFEDKILEMLKRGGDTILDNEELINSLSESKTLSTEVGKKLVNTRSAELKISAVQNNYIPVARASAVLYFCITDLSKIDYMYQFSMEWFISNFRKGMTETERTRDVQERVKNLTIKCREAVFLSVLPSLQENDKILFAFLISLKLQQFEGHVESWHLTFFLTGMCGVAVGEDNKTSFLSDKSWREVLQLNSKVDGLKDHILKNSKKWENFAILDKDFTTLPTLQEFSNNMPEPYNKQPFMIRMLILRSVKPESVMMGVKAYVKSILGEKFLQPVIFSLAGLFKEASPVKPFLFILTAGTDPLANIKRIAFESGYQLITVSLGKGQGEKAENLLKLGTTEGKWILLQNCHLASSWLPKLELLLEEIQLKYESKSIHGNFRLILTAAPNESFPVNILRKSIKFVSQLPVGLTSSLLNIYTNILESKEEVLFYESSNKPEFWKKLFFHLSFFHCAIRERLLFGPIGWNVQYEFSESDFRISARQVMQMVNQFNGPPFEVLNYLVAECNYGGKVTDDFDRRTLNELLKSFFNSNSIFELNHQIVPVPGYVFPNSCDYSALTNTIRMFPQVQSPEVFGLHANAGISRARKEGYEICERLLIMQSGSSITSFEEEKSAVLQMSEAILLKLRQPFDTKLASEQFPVTYFESMNTVLGQELSKYNVLIRTLRNSLENLQKVYAGTFLLTEEYEKLIQSILLNQIPALWKKVSYISSKSLLAYVEDLHKRLEFFNKWVNGARPKVFWLPGFFFLQSFLTATVQEFARKKQLPIDTLQFDFEVLNQMPETAPDFGSYVFGLFLEGARWNGDCLEESRPRELYFEFPVVRFK